MLSPDGRRLAFIARGSDGKQLLWVRPLDSLAAQPLSGTDGAGGPFWSPDSRFIGFFAEGKLRKIDASGGPPQTLCDAPQPRGDIVFTPQAHKSPLVDAAGLAVQVVEQQVLA